MCRVVALAKLKPSLQKITRLLKELSPEETEVEFGLKFGGETGVIVAKGTAEVNFTVRMTWKETLMAKEQRAVVRKNRTSHIQQSERPLSQPK